MTSRAIDWALIHRRLEVTAAAIGGSSCHSPEEALLILEARARVLAKVPAAPSESESLELLTFSLAAERYAVETAYVREVCQLKDLTALPGTPSFIAGVMSLHGQVLAVLDLRRLFELPPAGLTELNRIIVLRGEHGELGLLADAILNIRPVAVPDLQDGLPTHMGVRARFLRGITGQALAVLDGERLLNDAGLKVNVKTGSTR